MARSMVNGLGQGLHGDKTTTGAICLSSLPNATQGGRGVLRLGDRTTECPKCGKMGTIVESSQAIRWAGKYTALHGARVQCDCPAGSNRLIALKEQVAATPAAANPLRTTAGPASPQPAAAAGLSSPVSGASAVSTADDNDPAEPGFHIVQKSISRSALEAELFGDSPSPEVMRKFNGLNGSLGNDIVKAGQLVVLGDPRNYMCRREEAHLMQAAEEVAVALKDLDPEDADFMTVYQSQIAAILGSASTWTGVTAAGMEKHMGEITRTLQKLEALHVDTYRTYGRLNVPEFFSKRKVILDELNAKLLNSSKIRSALSLGNHPKLQKSLRISSKSLVHHWRKAGGPGEIPGYSKHVNIISKATTYMKHGGYLAIGIGGVSSALVIKEACDIGSTETCKKVAITETSKFTGMAIGGYYAAKTAMKESAFVCYKLAPNPRKYLACSVAVVATSSYFGAEFGTIAGQLTGEIVIEVEEAVRDHFLYD